MTYCKNFTLYITKVLIMKAIPTIVLTLSLLLIPLLAQSQIGIKLGVHSFDLNSPRKLIFPDSATVSYSDAKLGFQGGIYGRLDFTKFFLESRLMLNSTKVEYVINGDSEFLEELRSESFTNLDIPIVIGFDFAFLDLYGGPVAHLHLGSSSELTDLQGYKTKFSTAEFGYRVGLGTEFGNMNISFEYEGNFSKYGNHISIAGQDFDFGNQASRLIFNVGFKVF